MIRLHRPELSDTLQDKLSELTQLIVETPVVRRAEKARGLWRDRRPIRRSLTDVLDSFTAGHGRCMYCGDNEGTAIDHHEPIALAPLRTYVWRNHLLACSRCNSDHKGAQFPRDASMAPLLLDPTVDDPFEHLKLALSVGRYQALTERGEATLQVCGLNRDSLTEGRRTAYNTFALLLPHWHHAFLTDDHDRMAIVACTVREQPFADVCQAMLRYASLPGVEIVFEDHSSIVPILRMPELRNALLGP